MTSEVLTGDGDRAGLGLLADPEPRALWCPIISVDDHAIEPIDLFVDRVPAALRDDVPFVEDEDGFPIWVIGDERVPITTVNGASGCPMAEWVEVPRRIEQFRTGVWDPAARVRDMDLNGVYASLNFPSSVFGFAGARIAALKNNDAARAAVRAYNDWVHDDWCHEHRDRFIPCQLSLLSDPEWSAGEIRRNADRGFRALSFSEGPHERGFPSIYRDYWDPILRACEETETVVNLHVGSSGKIQQPSADSVGEVSVALFPLNGVIAMTDWIFAKVPVRFPGIKIAMSEAGVSWVPMVIERLRRAHRQLGAAKSVWTLDDPDPVDLVHRNFWFTSIEDPSAFDQLDVIGRDRVMVESDYPHYDSTWPDTQAIVESQLDRLDTATIRMICFENAAALYDHPLPPASWIDASVVG
jgi:predicted TIM-barrel fold metal-dependent hydrolase